MKIKRYFKVPIIVLFVCGIFSAKGLTAQDASKLTVDRIFNTSEFSSERFGPARWLVDGSGYTTLEPARYTDSGMDIVKYDPATGQRKISISSSKLIPEGSTTPLSIYDYSWSPNAEYLLIFTNTKRVWRTNTRGDYWVLNLNSGKLRQLGRNAPESTLMFTTFSPNSEFVGYVSENNVFSENVLTGEVVQLTQDGSRTIINGTFDWVYEEELGLQNGFRWSPDSKKIAFWQLDAEGVGEYLMLNTTDGIYSKVIPVQYPKVGTTNSAARLKVVNLDGTQLKKFDIPGDERGNYIARMDWAANSDEIIIQRLNRLQNTLQIMLGDANSGSTRTIYTEKDNAWIDVRNDLKWLDGGKNFTWVSEKDGWRHVYLISHDGKQEKLITNFDFDIKNIESIDEKGGWMYYSATPENATQMYLYRSKLNGKGKPERLTPESQPGTHRYQISHDSKWAIHTYSSFANPSIIELVNLPKHKTIRTFVDNSKLKATVEKLDKGIVEFHSIDIGVGTELDMYIMKPADFNPSKKYPVLFHVYGEPAGQTVNDSWGGSGYLWHLMLTQQGYIVMSVDNRGTPGLKGRDWRKSVYGKIGIIASQDQAAALKKISSMWDFVDKDRIGIWGWSGGGSMTLNMMFRFPELYHTGLSVAPVGNQRLYDTIYQERYMGLPTSNEYGYVEGSPFTYAKNLEGNLLIVHGTGDDNVHYQNAEWVINELIKHNKQFSMMAYPNRSHGIYEGENTTRHLRTKLTEYLMRNLPAGGKDR